MENFNDHQEAILECIEDFELNDKEKKQFISSFMKNRSINNFNWDDLLKDKKEFKLLFKESESRQKILLLDNIEFKNFIRTGFLKKNTVLYPKNIVTKYLNDFPINIYIDVSNENIVKVGGFSYSKKDISLNNVLSSIVVNENFSYIKNYIYEIIDKTSLSNFVYVSTQINKENWDMRKARTFNRLKKAIDESSNNNEDLDYYKERSGVLFYPKGVRVPFKIGDKVKTRKQGLNTENMVGEVVKITEVSVVIKWENDKETKYNFYTDSSILYGQLEKL